MSFSDSAGVSLARTEPELEASTDDTQGPLVGRLLCGKWRVERLLGTGGMSSVYAATHRNGKRVAVKVLSPELRASRRARDRFLREGYIANRVGHHGAVSVLDDDVTGDGLVFLVMELLEGETLSARCRRLGGRLDVLEALALIDQLLEVLSAAHSSGIIHRDIKPCNLFLTRDGQLKLLDFGIASLREIAGSLSQTHSGAQLGTPGFMAPEQARGRWSEVTARTDVWATGATLFRVLTGRLVHEAQTRNEALIAAATQPAPALATIDRSIPGVVAAVVDKALCLEPDKRWQNAAAMCAALASAQAELAARGQPATPPKPKRAGLRTAAAALGLGMTALAIGATAVNSEKPAAASPDVRPHDRALTRTADVSPSLQPVVATVTTIEVPATPLSLALPHASQTAKTARSRPRSSSPQSPRPLASKNSAQKREPEPLSSSKPAPAGGPEAALVPESLVANPEPDPRDRR